MVDEAHGAGVLGARGAGRVRAARRRGPRRPADGHVLEVAGLLRRLHRRHAEVIEFLRISSRARSCSPPPPCRPRSARRWPRCGSSARDEGRELFARVLDNAALPARRAARARLPGRRPQRCRRRTSSRRSSRWSSATTGRPCCCGGRSTTPASTSTSRIHPAVPPGGALLRTSVMATHDRRDARPGARGLRRGQAAFEAEHGPLPGPGRADARQLRPDLHKDRGDEKTCALSERVPASAGVDRAARACRSFVRRRRGARGGGFEPRSRAADRGGLAVRATRTSSALRAPRVCRTHVHN